MSEEEEEYSYLGSLEKEVYKWYSLKSRERKAEIELDNVRYELEMMKRNSALMTIVGDTKRLQMKHDDPEKFAKLEKAKKKKAKAKVNLKRAPPQAEQDDEESPKPPEAKRKAGTSRSRLSERIEKAASEVDKSLQTMARK